MMKKWKFARLAKCLLGLTIPVASVMGTVACLSAAPTKEIDGEDVVFSYKMNDGTETYVKANEIWSDMQNGGAQEFNDQFFSQVIHMIMIEYYKSNTDHADYFESREETVDNTIKSKEDQYKTQYGTDWEGRLQQEVYDPIGGKQNFINNELYNLIQSDVASDLTSAQITKENDGGFDDLTDAQKAIAYDYVAVAKPILSRQIGFKWATADNTIAGEAGSYYNPYISSDKSNQKTSPIQNIRATAQVFKNRAGDASFLLDDSALDDITTAGGAAGKKAILSFNAPVGDTRFEYAFLTILANQLAGTDDEFATLNIDHFTNDNPEVADDVLKQAFDPEPGTPLANGIWKGPDTSDPNKKPEPWEQVILDVGGGWRAGKFNNATEKTGGPSWIDPVSGDQKIPSSPSEFQTIKKVVSGDDAKPINNIYFVRANDGFYFVQIDPTFLADLKSSDLKTYTDKLVAHYKEQKDADVSDDDLDYDLITDLSSFITDIGNEKAFFKMLISVDHEKDYDLDLDPLDHYLSKITIEPKYQAILSKIYNSQISGKVAGLTNGVYPNIDKENSDESKAIPVEFMPLFKPIYDGNQTSFQNLVQTNYLDKLNFEPISIDEGN